MRELYSKCCCVLNMHTFITEMLESVYKHDMKSLLHYGDWEGLRWKSYNLNSPLKLAVIMAASKQYGFVLQTWSHTLSTK